MILLKKTKEKRNYVKDYRKCNAVRYGYKGYSISDEADVRIFFTLFVFSLSERAEPDNISPSFSPITKEGFPVCSVNLLATSPYNPGNPVGAIIKFTLSFSSIVILLPFYVRLMGHQEGCKMMTETNLLFH